MGGWWESAKRISARRRGGGQSKVGIGILPKKGSDFI
jgi:hypothetical protein